MMIKFTKEETQLYNRLEVTNDPKEIDEIRRKLKEISDKRDNSLKDCPFEH